MGPSGIDLTVGGDDVVINNTGGAQLINAVENGKYTFASGQAFEILSDEYASGDSVGVGFRLEDNKVVAVGVLNGEMSGDFTGVEVNGSNFDITETVYEGTGDGKFTVVGNNESVTAIKGLSGAVALKNAGGIATLETDDEVAITDANGMIIIIGDKAVTFTTDGASAVTAISNLDEQEAAAHGALDGLTINDKQVDVDGDNILAYSVNVNGADALVGVSDGATVKAVANASTVGVDGDGQYDFFGKQQFEITGEGTVDWRAHQADRQTETFVDFVLNEAGGNEVVAIENLDGTVSFGGASAVGISVNDTAINFNGKGFLAAVGGASGTALDKVTGIISGDSINADTTVELTTFGGEEETFHVNGKEYVISNDLSDVTIKGSEISGLDEDATMTVSEGPVTVNGVEFTSDEVAGNVIVGDDSGNSAYIFDPTYPLINNAMSRDSIEALLGMPENPEVVTPEGEADLNYADPAVAGQKKVYLDGSATQSVAFNDEGKNEAVVDDSASGTKNIVFGNGGDLAIVDGGDEVNILGGSGNDSVVVRDSAATTFNMLAGGEDKLFTYAAANGKVTLENYDATSGDAIVVHERKASDLQSAITSDLFKFQDGVVTIQRGDNKTEVVVNGNSSTQQTLVKLENYKGDQQLVGFTNSTGVSNFNTADISDNIMVLGNTDGSKAGASITTGAGNDSIYAGKNDTVNAGAGSNMVSLNGGGAEVVIAEGNTTINGLTTGYGDSADVLNVNINDNAGDASYDGTNLIISGTGYSGTAAAGDGNFVNIKLKSGNQTYNGAVVATDKYATVTDSAVPNYFRGNDSGVDFSSYTGDVTVDIDGNWTGSKIAGDTAYYSGIVSLKGGYGKTEFYGGSGEEYLQAGAGETSLYGAGGNNVLIGYNGSDKFGSTEFFVLGMNDGAVNLIQDFQFGVTETSDKLTLDLANNDVTEIVATTGGSVTLQIKNGDNVETAVIENAVGKDFMVDDNTIAQIGTTSVTFDGVADFYDATEENATVKVASGVTEAKIWLESPERSNGVDFVGDFTVIDARGSTATVELAGNNVENTIYAGSGDASLWGGAGDADDVLYGSSSGHNTFYYEIGNGHDVINNAKDGDVINITGSSMDDIDFANTDVTNGGTYVSFKDGGSLTVNSTADISFVLSDNQDSITYKANHNTKNWDQQ